MTNNNKAKSKTKALADRSKDPEILYWCELLNCTEKEFRESIVTVCSSDEIRNYFNKQIS